MFDLNKSQSQYEGEKYCIYIYNIYIYNYSSAVKLQTLCGQVEDKPVIILNQSSCYD
jgi:hypothetical protein